MGWQDRDYGNEATYRDPTGTPGGVRRPPPTTLTLMIVHGVMFLVMLVLAAEKQEGASIPLLQLVDARQHPAGIILHPIASARVFGTAFVVLALWSLAGRLEQRLGGRRMLLIYGIGSMAAGTTFHIMAQFAEQLAKSPLDYPVGALAAMCVVAWGCFRNDSIQVLGRTTTIAKVYAICAAIVAALELMRGGQGAVAWLLAAAAGGAAAPLSQWLAGFRGRRRRVVRPSIPHENTPRRVEPDIDDVLVKISRDGMNALSDEEHRRLEEARRAKLDRGQ